MAECVSSLSGPGPGQANPDGNRELRSQLAQSKQDIMDLRERGRVLQDTAYCLANQLQKHECGEYKWLVEAVLGVKPQCDHPGLTEKRKMSDLLRRCCRLLKYHNQELNKLRQQLQLGRAISEDLLQHLEFLLEDYDPDNYEGFRHKVDTVCMRAAILVSTLRTERREVFKEEEDQEPRAPSPAHWELDKEEGPEDTGRASSGTPPEALGSTDNGQPHSDDQLAAPALVVDMALQVALHVCVVGARFEEDSCAPGVPDSQSPQEEEGNPDGLCPRPGGELTSLVEDGSPGDALDEHSPAPSLPPDEPEKDWPSRSTATCSWEDPGVHSALQVSDLALGPCPGPGHLPMLEWPPTEGLAAFKPEGLVSSPADSPSAVTGKKIKRKNHMWFHIRRMARRFLCLRA